MSSRAVVTEGVAASEVEPAESGVEDAAVPIRLLENKAPHISSCLHVPSISYETEREREMWM